MAVTKPKGEKPKAKPAEKHNAAGVNAIRIAKAEDSKDEKVENWAEDEASPQVKEAVELYDKIQRCYDNQEDHTQELQEYWSIHSAQPDDNQQYTGNSQCYIPVVRDAIGARVKRSLAQLFPTNHKHVDVVTSGGDAPQYILALLEHYIRIGKIKNIVRADLIAGDVTGQWNLYVDWKKSYRQITKLVKKPPIKENAQMGVSLPDPGEEEEQLEEEEVITEGPDIVPVATEDVAVYPATANSSEDAIAVGIRLRMTKDKVQQMIDDGIFVGVNAANLMERLGEPDASREKTNPQKRRVDNAGIKTSGTSKYVLVYEVATDMKLDGDRKEPVLVYYVGQKECVGVIKNPFWSGKRPLISASIEEVTGSFFGISKVEPVKFLQWNLNDFWNMGMDSAQYALLPITMVDPVKNPQYETMVMGLAAVWLTDPNSTKFQSFPPLWKDAMQVCQGIKSQIYESMDVNEAMMGKMPAGRKNNQLVGNMQQEQQVNITDHATRYEEMILNPLIERIFEMDQQFRTEEMIVQTKGEIGARAMLVKVPPTAFEKTYYFRWLGTEFQKNIQRQQQMIAAMNVMRGIPPEQLNGRRFDATPILEFICEQVFGPELAPKIFIDERNLFTVPPEIENNMLASSLLPDIHPGDDHIKHLQSHDEAAKITQDPTGAFRTHINAHMKALQEQSQKMMGQQQQKPGGMPGMPGGAGPGVAGSPRMGAQPGAPRPQGPPGMVPQDAALGAPGRG